ncbi:MAG: MlaE family lipid ABC transporter permease subunit [Formivibrio sp.]|nr:MlaE family lipid ABC transporter permease subunit [Formivibrio sp.]
MSNAAILAPSPADSGTDYTLTGELDIAAASLLWPQVRILPDTSCIDARGINRCDGAGAAMLFDLARRGIKIIGLDPAFQQLVDILEPGKPLAGAAPHVNRPIISRVGFWAHEWVTDLIEQVTFIGAAASALAGLIRRPRDLRWQDFLTQCELTGTNALPIVSLISFLIGVILSFQSVLPLRQFGAEIFVANLLGLSLIREMSPLITAILLAGRTGAAFAAEIGTMKVNEEINALVTFGFDPIRFLVLPRLLAGLLMAPLLTVCAELVGLAAGALVLEGFGIPFRTFIHQVASFTDLHDLLGGLFKAALFGLEVAAIGCLRGLSTGAGASAVGSSTTRAVVQTLVILVITDGIMAVIYYQLGI